MPVEAPDVIDLVAEHAESQQASLVMVEVRDWNSTPQALSQLNTKMSLYATYVLTGRFHQQYPDMANFQVSIQLDHFMAMPASVETLLRDWAGKLTGANISVCSRRYHWNLFARLLQKAGWGKSGEAVVRWSPPTDAPSALLTPIQFTEEFAASLRRGLGNRRVEIVPPFELKLTDELGKESSCFTDNAYGLYLSSPEQNSEFIQKFTAGVLETRVRNEEPIDPKRIVPVLKGKSWGDQSNQGLTMRGKKPLEYVSESYNDELTIFYAEDHPKSVRYLSDSDLEKLQLQKSELRQLSCANLKRLLPVPEIERRDDTFRVMAGGDYDASLLLLEDVWRDDKIQIAGEMVVAVPSRDMLLVVGSHDSQAVQWLKRTAQEIFAQAPCWALTRRHLRS